MARVKSSKKFDVFMGAGPSLGFPMHLFIYVEKKRFQRGWRFDSGVETFKKQKDRIKFLKELDACQKRQKTVGDNTYPGVLTKTFTTRKDIETKRMGNFFPAGLSPRVVEFTLMQYIFWQRTIFSPFRNEPYALNKGGINCFDWTSLALAYAKLFSKMPLYP